jgi:hypothetical protein
MTSQGHISKIINLQSRTIPSGWNVKTIGARDEITSQIGNTETRNIDLNTKILEI